MDDPDKNKKMAIRHGQPIFIVNLKSNTMKTQCKYKAFYVMKHTFSLGNLIYLNLFNENMLYNIINRHHLQ